jgi:hypothetical protein
MTKTRAFKEKCLTDSKSCPHRQDVVSEKPKRFWWLIRAQWPKMRRSGPNVGKKRRVAEPSRSVETASI